ncbi:zinc-binding dehydrogenase [Rubrobacter marinus]|uniref:Zinc-binding dehydrogenase n=1 Tax=Rubrobacter marinus TaxID=2653852 RepID=A0A6G8PYL4_9ACTN|nr:zinc-binding dehydrogenase [Rubrobacter marinus]QIN79303.1 zinc-binding dehydrogenase [Rubrobacter marinus]
MAEIRAVLVDPDAPARLALGGVPAPSPDSSQAVVRVAAISLNRGEVNRAQAAEAGFNPGWDLAGTVERAAADGSGPAEGARVVGLKSSGAWAENVAVPTVALAELPDNVSFAEAATLPVAGLTALYALEMGGNLLGRTVLVTGASGGAGDFALRLGRLSGGRVVALVRRAEHEPIAREAGADEVAVGDGAKAAAGFGPYDLILDSVGGPVLGEALSMLAPEGTCVAFGGSASYGVTFDVRDFYLTGGAKVHGFILFHEVLSRPASVGLARLASLVSDGRLAPRVEVEASWTEVGPVAKRLLDRGFTGKAVLHVAG